MKRFVIMCMVLGVMVGTLVVAEAQEGFDSSDRTVEASYYGPQVLDQLGICASSGEAGCVTIETFPYERLLVAKVVDAQGFPVTVRVADRSDGHTYGAFCGETTSPIHFAPGADLELWLGDGWWPRWWLVPLGCYGYPTTGTVSVRLSGNTLSEPPPPAPAESPAPGSSPPSEAAMVERSLDLGLRGHLRAVGSVAATDTSCRSNVPVLIQRKTSGSWVDVVSSATDAQGAFRTRLRDQPGRYRATVAEIADPARSCLEATSAPVRHRH
jgi:hypothetical protein